MTRPSLVAVILALAPVAYTPSARAQTANASPTTGRGSGAGDTVRTAPSGSTAFPNRGQPQIGAPTPLERHEERKSEKDTTSVCKGC